MKKNYLLVLALFLGFNVSAFAQGKISGLISDQETGEEIIGATIYLPSIQKGAATDIFGKYFIDKVPAGVYTLEVSYISYQKQIVQDIIVKDGEVTELNVNLSADMDELEAVVVTAESIKNSTEAILSIQKKAIAVQDGISVKEIKKMGASNAAESMKYVTGASVEDGKYMVVRGLGDRYSITQMNGVTMPSSDPYRNSTSLDLIPSDMIDNLITVKTFTPDQPGNFTGGKLDITTKSLPDEFYFNFGVSTSYNTQSNLKSGFLTDATKGKYDALGYDDGGRARPLGMDDYKESISGGGANEAYINATLLNDYEAIKTLNSSSKSLSNTFVPDEISTPLNYGVDISTGNRLDLFGRPLGYNLGISYSKDYAQVTDGFRGDYILSSGDLNPDNEVNFRSGQISTQVGGIASLAYQLTPNHEISLLNLYTHQADVQATKKRGHLLRHISDASTFYNSDKIDYKERLLNNTQLSGKHHFENLNGLKLDWTAGYVIANQDQPDLRVNANLSRYNEEKARDVIWIDYAELSSPTHFFRELKDKQYNFKWDLELPLGNKGSLIKVGGNISDKQRVFKEYSYEMMAVKNTPSLYKGIDQVNGDFNEFFSYDNTGYLGKVNGKHQIGNYYKDNSTSKNNYDGKEVINAGYVMGVADLGKFKIIGGVRAEQTLLESISEFVPEDEEKNRNGKIDKLDLLPSLNLVYKLNEKMNLRFAYSHTVARPNMREISNFRSIGAPDEYQFTGNSDLKRTLVKNIDLRYELFPKGGEIFAVSAYYKHFTNPIFMSFAPNADNEITPINVESGQVFGLELEARKKLDFISDAFRGFTISSNVSIIHSTSEITDAEKKLQENSGRTDLGDTRPFQGQSPYIVNAALSHRLEVLEWENSLSYNLFGERLALITAATDPDVYEQGRGTLNFVSTKKLGDNFSVSFKASNLLDPEFKRTYKDYENYVNRSFKKGRSFSLSLSYKL